VTHESERSVVCAQDTAIRETAPSSSDRCIARAA
jgi:hypothetical protein